MTVLLDTNVIMDALQERVPFNTAAKEILRRSQNGGLTCVFTANTMTDIFYLFGKARDTETAHNALSYLLNTYEIAEVTKNDCVKALALPIGDFEDALIAVCADKIGAEYIVTRDYGFLRADSPVTVIEPPELLKKLG